MEWKVVLSLDFHLNPPTALSFAIHFLLLLPNEINEGDRKELFESTRFVVELSVADSFFVACKPSIIAAAAIIMTLHQPSTLSRYHQKYCIGILTCSGYATFGTA